MKLKSINVLAIVGIASMSITAFASGPVSSPVTAPIMLNESDSFVPASFSADGKPMLSFTSFDTTDGTSEVQVLDSSIESIASFTVPADPSALYDYKTGPIMEKMYWEKIERDTLDLNVINLDEYLLKLDYHSIAKYIVDNQSEGEVYGNTATSFEVLPTGEKVIKHFTYITNKYCIEVKCSGNCKTDVTFDVDSQERYYVQSPLKIMSLVDYDNGTSTLGGVAVTQTLFNNDSNFEYVSPLLEEGNNYQVNLDNIKWSDMSRGYVYDFGDYFAFESDYVKEVKEPGRCIGFTIKDQNGSEIQSVKFESGYSAASDNFMSIIIIGNKKYLSCNLTKDKTSYTVLYEIVKEGNGVKQVGAFKTGVHPTLVSRGENVMVDFENADNSQVSVAVTDITGKVMYRKTVDPAAGSLAIPSETMAEGMNIVTVYGDNAPQNSTKVIVK